MASHHHLGEKGHAGLLSPEDVDKLYHHFLLLDADGNGTVSREEFLQLPAVASNPLALRLLEMLSADRSGDISFSDFVQGITIFSARNSAEEKLKFAFRMYDLDCDGFISNGELFLVMRMMTGDKFDEEQLQQIVDKTIRDADADGDGRLSFPEFLSASAQRNTDLVRRWRVADL